MAYASIPYVLSILSCCHAASTFLSSVENRVLPSLDAESTIGVRYIPMTDTSRLDPFSNNTKFRQVMVSLFYPVATSSDPDVLQKPLAEGLAVNLLPYMPPTTAALYDELVIPAGFPEKTHEQLSTRCYLGHAMPARPTSYPLMVFSPGGGASRFSYTTILEDLARQGFVVAAVDHPHDALIVEFPDGEAVLGLNKTLTRDDAELLVKIRAQDLSFVIDQLGQRSSLLSEPLNTTNAVAFGHSLGGAAVAEAMLNDTRIKGGINVDGRLFGSMEKGKNTLSRPFLQFASEETTDKPYYLWDEAWQRLVGWKLELFLAGAAHSTFTDYPLIAETYSIRKKLGKAGEELLGTVDGKRGLEITVQYLSAFARFAFTGRNERLLQDDEIEYPEVKTKRRQ